MGPSQRVAHKDPTQRLVLTRTQSSAFPERVAHKDPIQRLVLIRTQRSLLRRGGAELQLSGLAQLEGHVAAAPAPPFLPTLHLAQALSMAALGTLC